MNWYYSKLFPFGPVREEKLDFSLPTGSNTSSDSDVNKFLSEFKETESDFLSF